jgi:hypothetical protein
MGGKVVNFLNLNISKSWLIIVGFVIQFSSIYFFPDYLYIAIIISNIALLLFSYFNLKQEGFKYIMFGILLNVVVMAANGGRMPVDPVSAQILSPADYPALAAGQYGKHLLISAGTHLNFLGDIFFLSKPYPRPIIISLGDILLTIGVIMFIYRNMVSKERELKEVMENAI